MTPNLRCRSCGSPLSHVLVDLGRTPLANSYVRAEDLCRPDDSYPLVARVCDNCFLVQVEDVLPPEAIFSDYAYFSSWAASWVEHARRYAEMMIDRFRLADGSKVIELASNDGYLLQHFVARGIPVLGVEPAANVARTAVEKGVPTEVAFFGMETARRLHSAGHVADVIVSNNVLAHVPDINDFVAGIPVLLKPTGVWTIEFPHLLNLLEQTQFDTIYHEHFSYLSLLAVEALFARHDLRVFDVEEVPTHGGSLRVFVCHRGADHADGPGLHEIRRREAAAQLHRPEAYDGFEPRVQAIRADLLAFLRTAKAEGKTVAAYGAAAKGNTMLNYCGIGVELIDYVVDRSPAKQGRWLPGSRLPIHAPARILETRPEYVLILPWNLRDEIVADLAAIRSWGGRFVTAVPRIAVF